MPSGGPAMKAQGMAQFRRWLSDLAACGAMVPAAEVLSRLGDGGERPVPSVAPLEPDLTAEQAGEALGRSPSTVRAYAREGLLPGSYRQQGREWRIPATAIDAFRADQSAPVPEHQPRTPRRRGGPIDLGSWRKEVA